MNDADINSLDEFEDDSGNITTDVDFDEDNNLTHDKIIDIEKKNQSLVSNENKNFSNRTEVDRNHGDKLESTSSYHESTKIYNRVNDMNPNKTTDVEAISNVSQEKIKCISKENFKNSDIEHENLTHNNQSSVNWQSKTIVDLSPSIEINTDDNVKSLNCISSSIVTVTSYPHKAENFQTESTLKQDVKLRQSPPEPPPRKYFTKQSSPSNFNDTQLQVIFNFSFHF